VLHPWLQSAAPLGREKAAPSGRVREMILPSTTTGCAPPAVQRPVLHPWLQSAAPLGRVRQLTTVSTGSASGGYAASSLHPWLQSAAPLGREKAAPRGGCAKTRTLPRVAHRPLCSGRCFTRGYNPPPHLRGGSVNSRPFPRVPRRAAVPPRRFTRGYTPRPRWGRRSNIEHSMSKDQGTATATEKAKIEH